MTTTNIALSKQAAPERTDRYAVSVEDYIKFKRDGFLVVRGLVSQSEIAELRQHTEDLMQGRLPEQTKQMPKAVSRTPPSPFKDWTRLPPI